MSTQADHIELLRDQLALYQKTAMKGEEWSGRLASIRLAYVEKQTQLSELRRKYNASQAKFAQLEDKFRDYKGAIVSQARKSAIGERMAVFSLKNEKTYYDVFVKKADDIGFHVTHQTGRARIPYAEMPLELQQRYFFYPKEALQARRTENPALLRREIEAHLADPIQ